MNAHGLRKCIQEKEEVIARCVDLTDQNSQFQRECVLYDQDIERLMESYDELGKDNEELKTQLNNSTSVSLFSILYISFLMRNLADGS